MLRALELGISIRDLDELTIGLVIDMYIEKGRDLDEAEDGEIEAGQEEFDAF